MKAFIPVDAAAGSDFVREFFLRGWPHVYDALQRAQGVDSVAFLVDDREIREHLADAGCSVLDVVFRPLSTPDILPRGFFDTLGLGREILGDEAFCLVDFGAACLEPEHVEAGLALYGNGEFDCVSSVALMRDNPVQLKSYWTVRQFGPVLGIDEQRYVRDNVILTDPFPYDWALNVCGASGVDSCEEAMEHGEWLLAVGDHMARACYEHSIEDCKGLYAVGLDFFRPVPLFGLCHDGIGTRVAGFAEEDSGNVNVRFSDARGQVLGEFDSCSIHAMAGKLPLGPNPVAYTVLAGTLAGSYVKSELLQPDGVMASSREYRDVVNGTNDKPVAGRQDFMDHVSMDGRFVMGTLDALRNIEDNIRAGRVGGVTLPEDVIRVEDPLDEILCTMMRKGEGRS